MSTFFEKLTRQHTSVQPDEYDEEGQSEDTKESQNKILHKDPYRDQKDHSIKVGDDNNSFGTEEEEGELTLDIYDKDHAIFIQSAIAGVKPEDLDISITNETVTIRGRRERKEIVDEKDFYYKELYWGSFARSIILPEEVNETEAEASFKNGLLTIRIPKKRRDMAQKLKVKLT